MKFDSKIMTLIENRGVAYLQYNSLKNIPFINHAFSTRLGGVSEGEFSTMNLSFGRGDSDANVTENYKRFCTAANFDYNSLVASSQDHNTVVRNVTHEQFGIGIYKPKDILSVDALITNEPKVTLVTYYADCTPLFFVDTKNKAVGLAHAGWRGTVGRIGQKVIEKMQAKFNTNPADLVCAVGPTISKCCYEVDTQCANQFFNLKDLATEKFVSKTSNEKYLVDLLEANRQILVSAGVSPDNITVSDICTKCNSDLLWSHRATNGKRGTMCAMMCIN